MFPPRETTIRAPVSAKWMEVCRYVPVAYFPIERKAARLTLFWIDSTPYAASIRIACRACTCDRPDTNASDRSGMQYTAATQTSRRIEQIPAIAARTA